MKLPAGPTQLLLRTCMDGLNLSQYLLLEFLRALHLLASVVGSRLAVQREEGTQIELRCLEELDLADVNLYMCQPTG